MPTDLIIVGAPRSGTNMLRDVLTAMPGIGTWPCDEIPLIWRHGNRTHPDDELQSSHARPEVRAFLRSSFDKLKRRQDLDVVVEKTCATSLRVEFVREAFPDAKYLFITRDGLDVTASAMKRWNAPLDLRYTARKARFVPPGDVVHYGSRFVRNTLQKQGASDDEVRTWWGPKPRNFRELMAGHSLDEVCLLQWQQCVKRAEQGLAGLADDQLMSLSYEAFVRDPAVHTDMILGFLDRKPGDIAAAVAGVSPGSVGNGRRQLGAEAVERLETLGGSTLTRHADG